MKKERQRMNNLSEKQVYAIIIFIDIIIAMLSAIAAVFGQAKNNHPLTIIILFFIIVVMVLCLDLNIYAGLWFNSKKWLQEQQNNKKDS